MVVVEFTTYCANSPQIGGSVMPLETALKSGWITEGQYREIRNGVEVVVEDDANFRTYARLVSDN